MKECLQASLPLIDFDIVASEYLLPYC